MGGLAEVFSSWWAAVLVVLVGTVIFAAVVQIQEICPALPSRLAEPHHTHHNTNIIMTKNKWDQRNTATATANNLTDG